MIDIIILLIGLIGLIIATYTDLKNRKVPDPLTYSLMGLGLILNIFNGHGLLSVLFLGLFFVIGYGLYGFSFWGGGDAKLLAGMGALFPTNPYLYKNILFFGNVEFILLFLIYLFIIGLVYGIVWKFFNEKSPVPYVPVFMITFVVLYLQSFI